MSDSDLPDWPQQQPGENPQEALNRMLQGLFGDSFNLHDLPPELREMLSSMPGLPLDPASMQAMMGRVERMMTSSDENPVNWETAQEVARQVASAGGEDPSISTTQLRVVTEAIRTADLWLDRVTDLPSATARTYAWSRAEWVEHTQDTWKVVVEPIAISVGEAMSSAMTSQVPEEMRGAMAEAAPIMRSMGSSFFGLQLGQAVGALARVVVSSSDTGLPLLEAGRVALLPTNVSEFGQGLGIPEDEIRLYIALREAAFARLMASVSWLRGHLLTAVTDYARGIRIDADRIEETMRQIDPSDPEAMQQALSSGLFLPERSPEQQAALERLELALALTEGWVDEVVNAAAQTTLPHADQLRETLRRRRAAGGPAEHTFASLVGLELRPRRLREAAAVWAAITQERGVSERDQLWRHPDLVPTAEAFEDPLTFARGRVASDQEDAMDLALAELLDEEKNPKPKPQDDEATDGETDAQGSPS